MICKKDLEARSLIVPKFQPVASHGNPFQARFSEITNPMYPACTPKTTNARSCFSILLAGTQRGVNPSEKNHIECLYL